MPDLPIATRRVVPDPRGRDTLLAVGGGLLLLGFILAALYFLWRQSDAAGGMEGIIVRKEFISQPEAQITFGANGLHTRQIAGTCVFHVRPADAPGPEYQVRVDPKVYDSFRVGDHYYFIRPAAP